MDNNFNRVRLCGRAAGEPELSHINHGESFYRFPLSVERLSGQEDRLPVILPRPLLEAHPVHTGDVLTLTGQLRSFNNYTKTVDGVGQERTAYEVSIMRPAEPEEFFL